MCTLSRTWTFYSVHFIKEACYEMCCVHVCYTPFASGNGKTHYIRRKMKFSKGKPLTIVINESFSANNVIQQLRSLPMEPYTVLYFSFTLLPPAVSWLYPTATIYYILNNNNYYYDIPYSGNSLWKKIFTKVSKLEFLRKYFCVCNFALNI